MINFQQKRGFTILLAMLITSIMTSISIAIFSIAQKELKLSSITRDSQFAFYAADSGAECALYLHFAHNAFATSTTFTNIINMNCDNTALLDINSGIAKTSLGGAYNTTFGYDITGGDGDEYCVRVNVEKRDSGYPNTRITSLGYNTSCDSRSSSLHLLERSVSISL